MPDYNPTKNKKIEEQPKQKEKLSDHFTVLSIK
jgi:hypothetical protein